jgi:hypothetical protein
LPVRESVIQTRKSYPCATLQFITEKVGVTRDRVRKILASENLPTRHWIAKVFTLSASVTPNNGGTISPNCGTYDVVKQVTVVAAPNQYFKFN